MVPEHVDQATFDQMRTTHSGDFPDDPTVAKAFHFAVAAAPTAEIEGSIKKVYESRYPIGSNPDLKANILELDRLIEDYVSQVEYP